MDDTTSNVITSCWTSKGAAGVTVRDAGRHHQQHHQQQNQRSRQALGFAVTLMFHVTVAIQLLMICPCHAVSSSPYDCDAMGSFEDLQRTETEAVVISQQPQQEDDAFYAIVRCSQICQVYKTN
mmetsp:Transcript_31411/g.75993  ORF Transcript_31411/g.75993 Transcript_31411/m.75993 type:complete len:124 (+) Transcript_31411:298-669(+)